MHKVAKVNIQADCKLLNIPNVQKKWLRSEYGVLIQAIHDSEFIDYSMLESNLFGINKRFLQWHSDLNGLVADYVMNYSCHPDKTIFIKDCLICALEDCKELEYFEIAHNLDVILHSFEFGLTCYCLDTML